MRPNRRQRIAAQRHEEQQELARQQQQGTRADGTRIDSHWVTKGDSAQQMLAEQGYRVTLREKRYGAAWEQMSKEVADEGIPQSREGGTR